MLESPGSLYIHCTGLPPTSRESDLFVLCCGLLSGSHVSSKFNRVCSQGREPPESNLASDPAFATLRVGRDTHSLFATYVVIPDASLLFLDRLDPSDTTNGASSWVACVSCALGNTPRMRSWRSWRALPCRGRSPVHSPGRPRQKYRLS